MIADEVMAGFGRTGEWFAVDHWNVVPDIITMAKGLTSAYVPLGAVGMRRTIADHFQDKPFPGGLTYNSHPLGCAAALATIAVYEEDDLIERARADGTRDGGAARGAGGAASVGRRRPLDRPVRHRRAGAQSHRRASRWRRSTARRRRWRRSASSSAQEGLYTFVRWNYFFTNPPLCITEAELREGFAIIDRGSRSPTRLWFRRAPAGSRHPGALSGKLADSVAGDLLQEGVANRPGHHSKRPAGSQHPEQPGSERACYRRACAMNSYFCGRTVVRFHDQYEQRIPRSHHGVLSGPGSLCRRWAVVNSDRWLAASGCSQRQAG